MDCYHTVNLYMQHPNIIVQPADGMNVPSSACLKPVPAWLSLSLGGICQGESPEKMYPNDLCQGG